MLSFITFSSAGFEMSSIFKNHNYIHVHTLLHITNVRVNGLTHYIYQTPPVFTHTFITDDNSHSFRCCFTQCWSFVEGSTSLSATDLNWFGKVWLAKTTYILSDWLRQVRHMYADLLT